MDENITIRFYRFFVRPNSAVFLRMTRDVRVVVIQAYQFPRYAKVRATPALVPGGVNQIYKYSWETDTPPYSH